MCFVNFRALGQIGRHTAEHARALAEADVLRRLLADYFHDVLTIFLHFVHDVAFEIISYSQ